MQRVSAQPKRGKCQVPGDEVTLARAVAKQHGMPFVDLTKGRIAPEVVAAIASSPLLAISTICPHFAINPSASR